MKGVSWCHIFIMQDGANLRGGPNFMWGHDPSQHHVN